MQEYFGIYGNGSHEEQKWKVYMMIRESESRFCLSHFLEMDSLRDSILLSGHSCLSQEVLRTNVVENLHIQEWAKAGEVVLSSGYPFRQQPSLLAEELPKLQKKGVSALGVKAGKGIPQEVIQMAVDINFPLIQLPPVAIFSNIVYECRDMILRYKEADSKRVQIQAQQILERLLHASSSEEYLAVVESAIGGNPIIACSDENEVILSKAGYELLYENMQADFIRRMYAHSIQDKVTLLVKGEYRQVQTHFFSFGSNKGCSILILECYRPLNAAEIEIINRINPVLVLEINNAIAIKKVKRKYKDRFVKNLITGKLGNEADICTIAAVQGYIVSSQNHYRVAVVTTPKGMYNIFEEKDIGSIRNFTQTLDVMMAFTLMDGLLVLVFEDGKTPYASILSLLGARLKSILRKSRLSFCVSEPYRLCEIPDAYAEARHIASISDRCKINDSIITHEKLGILGILAFLPQNKVITRYKDTLLNSLKQYDAIHNTSLLHTLDVYLSAGGNAKITAERLFTHYNTVAYRLERIREIAGYNLEDPEQVLQLRIALKMEIIQPSEK